MVKDNGTFFGSQCMFVCDQISLKILDINDEVVKRFGFQREEIIGKKLSDFGAQVTDSPHNVSEEKLEKHHLWEFQNKSNEKQLVQFSSHLMNYKGRPSKLIVAHDVQETSSKTERELPISSPIEFIDFPMAEIEWNSEQKILRWSTKAEQLFGWNQEEVINDPNMLQKFVHPDSHELVRNQFKEVVKQKKKSSTLLVKMLTNDNQVINCEWYNSYLFDDSGILVSTYSLVLDISKRVRALNRFAKVMSSFRDLFNSISDAIYLINDEGRILAANEGTSKTFGYNLEEVVGNHYKILSAPGKFKPDRFIEFKGNGQTSKFNGWGRKSNGEVFPSEILISSGNYLDQDVTIIIERDITDRKKVEEELKTRDHLLSDLFNTTPLGIALLNAHNEVIEINKGFENLFEYSKDEVLGLELDRIIVPTDDVDKARQLTETMYVENIVTKRLKKSGEVIDVIIYAIPIVIDGKTPYKYGIYVDITDRKRAEEEIGKSLKEKELLLAEVHHRVKNNLAVISGLLELQTYNTDDESAKRILKDSQLRIRSIALVHEKLYENENLSEIKFIDYIKELSASIEKTMGDETISIDYTFNVEDERLPLNQAIPSGLLLNEVLTNSFKHAFNETSGGKVQISLLRDGDDLVFNIKDNGIGMKGDMHTISKNSLGLKLIRTLTKQLNAEISLNTENGTEFEFRFKKEK